MLNPIWLNTFVTLIKTGHFTKTADKLFMTQPGVSQHIQKLEQACGHALIRRDKKSFEITEQGRLVYQYATQLATNELALKEQLAFDDPYKGQCSLSCSGALALVLYAKLLDLQTQHPTLIIELKSAPNHQIISEIQSGKIDVGIVTYIPNPSLFDVTEVGEEQLCLVLPNVINEKDDLSLLKDLGLINHPDAEHYLSLYLAQSNDPNFNNINMSDIPIAGFINQISQILEPVARGLGYTVLPKSAIDSYPYRNKLKIYQANKPVLETIYLIKRRNRQLPARFSSIIEMLTTHFSSTN